MSVSPKAGCSSTSQPASCRFPEIAAGWAGFLLAGRQTASICVHAPHHPGNGIGQRNGAATLLGSCFGTRAGRWRCRRTSRATHRRPRAEPRPRRGPRHAPRAERMPSSRGGRAPCRRRPRHRSRSSPAGPRSSTTRLADEVVAEQAGGGAPDVGRADHRENSAAGSRKLGSTPSAIAAGATSPSSRRSNLAAGRSSRALPPSRCISRLFRVAMTPVPVGVLGPDRGQGHRLGQAARLAHRCRKGAADLFGARMRIAATGGGLSKKAPERPPARRLRLGTSSMLRDRLPRRPGLPGGGLLRSTQDDAHRFAQLDQGAGRLPASPPVCSEAPRCMSVLLGCRRSKRSGTERWHASNA